MQLIGNNPNPNIREASQTMFSFITEFKLKQLNKFINASNNTLDLFLTKTDCNLNAHESLDPLSLIDRHHSAHILNLTFDKNTRLVTNTQMYNYSKGDFEKINFNLNLVNWNQLKNQCNGVDHYLDILYQHLYTNIDSHIPKIKYNYYKLVSNILEKRKMLFCYKFTNKEIFKEKHKSLRALCKVISKRDYNLMINNITQNRSTNPKKLWDFVNNKSNEYPKTMYYCNSESNNESELSELFANYFKSVYVNGNLDNSIRTNNIINSNCSFLHRIEITQKDIFDAVQDLKAHSSSGPDKIKPVLVIKCIEGLIQPLLILYNMIIDSGKFPSKFKSSFVIPIYKSGQKNMINNYRPIAIINVFSKILEKILFNKLSVHLNKFIIPEQHGGYPGRSTVTNLLVFNEYVSDAFSKNKSVQVAYLDIAKAFDTVDTSIIVNKLEQCGITGMLLCLIKNYLSDRKLIVKFNNVTSNPFNATTGIPQGSNLRSLLFNIFMNDVYKVIKFSKFLLFIDDLKIFLEYSDINELELLQNDIQSLEKWAHDNKINFNLKKCFTVNYTKNKNPMNNNLALNNKVLENVSSIKDLGILFQYDLDFNNHIESVILKSLKKVNYLKFKCKAIWNISLLTQLYNALVKSSLMYGSIIWSPCNNNTIYELEKVQNKFLKFLSWRTNRPMTYLDHDYSFIKNHSNIMSLQSSRFKNDMSFIFKLVNGIIDCPELFNKIKFYEPVNPLRTVKLNRVFVIDWKKIDYSVLQKNLNIINLNKEWVEIRNITLYQFQNLIYKNINRAITKN